jgi:murein DD-endopeptidase MepM/ murein hydrolase activator NlpD
LHLPRWVIRASAHLRRFLVTGAILLIRSAEFHPGIDFKGKRGDEVKCTASGKVVFAGWAGGYGNCIRIQHINDIQTVYGHLSKIKVKVGQQVNLGDEIGLVGSTGHSTGAHLHYEVRRHGKANKPG